MSSMRVIHLNNSTIRQSETLQPIFNNKVKFRERFLVNKGQYLLKLNVEDVAYFYISNDIVYAVTFSNRQYHIDTKIKKLEQELNPNIFRRVNGQVVVNVNCIHRIEPYFNSKLVVKTIPVFDGKIIVSKENSRDFKDWVDQ